MNKAIYPIQSLPKLDLKNQEVHIWYVLMPEQIPSARYIPFLDQAEKDRYHAYKAPAKQREFLFGRFFLKQILSAYLNLPGPNIDLAINQHKRPFLPHQEIQFNLSHSFGAFGLILSKKCKVGIDIEYCLRKINIEDGRHVFMPEEKKSLQAKISSVAKHEFLQRWTLKEAIYKAADCGPQLLFNEFSVDLNRLIISSYTSLLAPIQREIGVISVLKNYLLAYAIENPEMEELAFHFYQTKI